MIYREEIQRIKANNPDISHREAFSTAAKNVSGNNCTPLSLNKYPVHKLRPLKICTYALKNSKKITIKKLIDIY